MVRIEALQLVLGPTITVRWVYHSQAPVGPGGGMRATRTDSCRHSQSTRVLFVQQYTKGQSGTVLANAGAVLDVSGR